MRIIDDKEYANARQRRVLGEDKPKRKSAPAAVAVPDLTPLAFGMERIAGRAEDISAHMQDMVGLLATERTPSVVVNLKEAKKNFKITITERDRDGLIKTAKIEEA